MCREDDDDDDAVNGDDGERQPRAIRCWDDKNCWDDEGDIHALTFVTLQSKLVTTTAQHFILDNR